MSFYRKLKSSKVGLKTSGRWSGFPPPSSPTLQSLMLVGQLPDFQGIVHETKDSLKTKKIQNTTKVNLVKAFNGT